MLKGKTVLLGVTGGIAAYKGAALASLLVKQHAAVLPPAAEEIHQSRQGRAVHSQRIPEEETVQPHLQHHAEQPAQADAQHERVEEA